MMTALVIVLVVLAALASVLLLTFASLAAAGPLIGGLLVDLTGWQGLFWIDAAIALIVGRITRPLAALLVGGRVLFGELREAHTAAE